MERLVTVIGRGRSGTRAISRTLAESGVFMGATLNDSWDKVPPDDLYEACRVLGRRVEWRGGLDWDFSALHEGPIDPAFTRLIESYLADVLASDAEWRGWKLPETTLVYPWLVRLYPDIRYIGWVRDPRDCALGWHLTDDLAAFGVPGPPARAGGATQTARALSWFYQRQIVRATPPPLHYLEVRFEDFVIWQELTLGRLEAFLGFPLARVPVDARRVGRYHQRGQADPEPFLVPMMRELGYLG